MNGSKGVLDKALEGERITDQEALTLLRSRDLVAVGRVATSCATARSTSGG